MKSTRYELGPDDPIFHGGVQVFKPVSRPPQPEEPSTKNAEDESTEEEE